jgi:ArsR family transcriptional regulator
MSKLSPAQLLSLLKAAGDPTRLRLLALLAAGELNVKDLTRILGQSQPRLSRHLKLLTEAGLVDRFPDGSWVFFHLRDGSGAGELVRQLISAMDVGDQQLVRDHERAQTIKREREAAAQSYFRTHADQWDRIRALHVDEAEVEAAMRDALGGGPFDLLVDLGTGTGRMLELFADRYRRGLGLDVNQSMLAYARGRLEAAGLAQAQVRHGDIYGLSLDNGAASAVVMHQVLHFLSDPAAAIAESARVLAPGGRLLIVDFAPHDLEYLREKFAHERLGFSASQVAQWLAEAGLDVLGTRELVAPAGAKGDGLTVTIWVAQQPGLKVVKAPAARRHQLEGVR